MKKFLSLGLLMLSLTVSAAEIQGLSKSQIKDLNDCLSDKGLTFERITKWKNSGDEDLLAAQNVNNVLLHNFNFRVGTNETYSYNNGILVSGIVYLGGAITLRNAVISNTTFVGDTSESDFSGACLVNVRFYKAKGKELRRISRSARVYSNISND